MKEAVRYLGYGRNTADERTRMMIDRAFQELERTAGPKSICRVFDMEQKQAGRYGLEIWKSGAAVLREI